MPDLAHFKYLLPSDVVTLHAEIQTKFEASDINEEEFDAVRHAVAGRQREYLTGRKLVRIGLKSLNISDFALIPNIDRSPRWPEPIVGSITHSSTICAIALGLRANYRGIGIDIQETGIVKSEIWPLFCSSEDLNILESSAEQDRQSLASLIFSAKESYFKARFPLDSTWLDFRDLSIIIRGGRFQIVPARALCGGNLPGMGGYITTGREVLTSYIFSNLTANAL